MNMDVSKRFSLEVIAQMKADVIEAGGNEVFWVGKINDQGIITSVQVGARGNSDSVVLNDSLSRQGNVLIHNHPDGFLQPSEADQNVAYSSQKVDYGFYIVNNDLSDVYVVVEPIKSKQTEALDSEKCAFFLSKNGPLAKNNSLYEERPSQIELVREIASAFNKNKIGVFEAGTGVGKSFAYLIPSILWAQKNQERVIISTATINLQQQLYEKDIPYALKILNSDVKAVLLKGRQNYLCLRRLNDALSEKDLFTEDSELLDSIENWSQTSPSGSRDDMTFVPPDSVWSRVNSESDACMGGRCPYREHCFVMKVRKEANDANLVVVNHHLLFADIESRMGGAGYDESAVLPPYRHIVFDEAHSIEDSATSFFSESFTRFKVMKQINRLSRQVRGRPQGYLIQLSALTDSEDCAEECLLSIEDVKKFLINLDEEAMPFLEREFTLRIKKENSTYLKPLFEAIGNFSLALGKTVDLVRSLIDKMADDDKEIPQVWETKLVLRRLEDVLLLCQKFPAWDEHEDTVFWLQRYRLPPRKAGEDFTDFVQFVQTPLDIAPMMNAGVFEPMKSVVCTSATLKSGNSFSYWLKRSGLSLADPDRLVEKSFDSPFPYEKNVLLAVPKDAPMPDSSDYQLYIENSTADLIFAAHGRTLLLFTSYDSLKNTYRALHSQLYNAGISAYKQGDDDRFRLLEKFKADRESVLFATESFWEGVDVPGDSLCQVIIAKLPFSVPSDPVFAARREALEKKGASPFMELSVPQAVIKFRQGFGRLMRRSDDYGAVIVLDRRLVEKTYGRMFTSSLPKTQRMYAPLGEICTAVENFLNR